MEVIEYQDDVNAASPPLASPGSAGANSPPYSQHSQHAVSQSGFPERVPRVVRPTAVRLRPVLDRLPCCGYPGPIKIPLCGDLQCRHLPCYTWHQQHHWWAPASRSCESWEPSPPPASLSVDVQPRLPPQGLLREALLQQPAAAAAVDVTPVQATVTTPGGTVTLYSWPDPVQVADDDVVVVEQVQPPSPPKRARKAPAKPRTPRAPRKPRKAKKDAAKDEDVPGEGVAVDTDTRGALLRVIGLLCDRRGDLDDKDDDKDDDDLSFLQLQPSALRKVRRVLRGVAKALM